VFTSYVYTVIGKHNDHSPPKKNPMGIGGIKVYTYHYATYLISFPLN